MESAARVHHTRQVTSLLLEWMEDGSGWRPGVLRVSLEPMALTCGFNVQGLLQGGVVRQWGVEEGSTTTVVAGVL